MKAPNATKRESNLFGHRLLVLLGVGVLVGCNSSSGSWPTADLHGKVTIGGKSIPGDAEARIMFIPPMSGETSDLKPVVVPIEGGRYSAPDVPVGQLMVRFAIVRFDEADGNQRIQVNLVPEEIRDGYSIEVLESDGTRDFDL